jgi:hypothetical protein
MSAFGISGLSTRNNIRTAHQIGSVGVAGLDRVSHAQMAADTDATNTHGRGLDTADALRQRDGRLESLADGSERIGDMAARRAWRRGVWFADFTYITTPYAPTDNGGYAHTGAIQWRNGRASTFSRATRSLPLFLDSCGYRREMTRTAPQWAMEFDVYPAAIEAIDPDGYAAWDYPTDRQATLKALDAMSHIFPDDGRLWPVFSIRWTWDDNAHLSFAQLPGWASMRFADMIPLNGTQRFVGEEARERMVRQAIANALVMAADKDFRMMVERYGKVMLGGMVGCKCNRMARHIFTAVLCELFPDVQFWLLGQANFAVVNGLGRLGLLDRVWTDGTWWLSDAVSERFAYVEDGLITMHSFEAPREKDGKRRRRSHTFFTLTEMMAANLRSILAAYEGLWVWPPPEPLPVNLSDAAQVAALRGRYQAAQLELGL